MPPASATTDAQGQAQSVYTAGNSSSGANGVTISATVAGVAPGTATLTVGGQAGIAGHITIGTGAMIAAKSGVKDDIAPKSSVWGSPCLPLLLEQKIVILRSRLPELFKRVDVLEKKAGVKNA